MFGKLKGYKTYIVAATGVISAVAAYVVGDASLIDTVTLVITSLSAATLRNGIAGMGR